MRNTQATRLLFELSEPGRRAAIFPECDVPAQPLTELIPSEQQTTSLPELPELTEPEVIRHFVNLSTKNMSVDTHFYPLGSCTMKLNSTSSMIPVTWPEFSTVHPFVPIDQVKGYLEIIKARSISAIFSLYSLFL